MTHGKAEFVREMTLDEGKEVARSVGVPTWTFNRRSDWKLIGWVRVNGHERMLYGWKDAKPFVFPRPYGKGPKAPSDKYSEAKAWAQAAKVTLEAQAVFCNVPEFPRPKCPKCSRKIKVTRFTRQKYIGWTYAACPECNIIFNY